MRCLRCGHPHAPQQKFCGECGVALLAPMDTLPPATPDIGPEGERKPVTILFCDIVESTPLMTRLGENRMHRLLNEFDAIVREHVGRYDGDLNNFLGDGYMAVFGAPIAREDHALRAALAALAIRDAMTGRAWVALPPSERLQIRIGINSGPVVFGSVGHGGATGATAIGDAANVASRLQGLARPGHVACSEAVARAIRGTVDCRPLGVHSLKGKPVPVEVFELVAVRAVGGAGDRHREALSRGMLGRAREWAEITELIDALGNGRGSILTIAGEAGLGKSRLLAEARALAASHGFQVAQGACVSYGRTLSYWPFREALRNGLGIGDDDSEAAALARLSSVFARRFGDQGESMVPFMALLLGLEPVDEASTRLPALDGMAVRHQIFQCSLRVIEQLARERPLLFILDDWQWADTSSSELLVHLLPLCTRVPVVFAIASRPDSGAAQPPLEDMFDAAAAGASLPVRRSIILRPLEEHQARDLVRAALGARLVNPQLEARLLRQASGNPFYLEELVRMLVAARAIERDATSGVWREVGQQDFRALPDSVEAVVLARIDCLDASAKQLLKIASVAGRRFSRELLAAAAGAHPDVEGDIARLLAADLLEFVAATTPELRFRHPLVHQAVYASLLEEQRQRQHEIIGRAMERMFEGRLDEVSAVLALHFARAEDWERAQKYLLRAGTQAGRLAADAEALEHYESALRAGRAAGRKLNAAQRAEVEASMAEALYRRGQNDAALAHALPALASLGFSYPQAPRETRKAIAAKLAARTSRLLLRPLRSAGPARRLPADDAYHAAARLFEVIAAIDYFLDPPRFVLGTLTMLEEAEQRPLSRARAISTSSLGLVCDSLGLYRLAAALHRRALRAAGRLDDTLALGYANHLLGMHQYCRGQWQAALRTLDSGVAQLQTAGHLRFQASCIGATYFVRRSMGDPLWIELADEQLRLAQESKDDHAIAWAVNAQGVAALYRGDHAAARVLFERASVAYEAIPDYRFLSGAYARRALCHALAGEIDVALDLLRRSHSLVRRFRIAGLSASAPLLVAAEANLKLVSQLDGDPRRDDVLRRAALACGRATRHARGVGDESAAEALRLSGMLHWERGDKTRARNAWKAAIRAATAIGAHYVLARTHFVVAQCTGDAEHAQASREWFERTGGAPFLRA